MLSWEEFKKQYTGIKTGNTEENLGECVGLVEVWIAELGLPHIWGNAKDLLANADPQYFDIIYNDPKNYNQFPVQGDIMVFGASWGAGWGHTGIVDEATGKDFILFEQNNPEGNPPELIGHPNYTGVLGWLHSKNLPQTDQSAIIDELRKARDDNWNLHLQDQKTISDLTKDKEDLQTQLQNLRDAFDKQTSADADTGAQLIDAQHKANDLDSVASYLKTTPDLKSILEAIDKLQQPIEEQIKPLEKHALTLQEALDDFITNKKYKSWLDKLKLWLKQR